jgi:hypothetical protein
MENDWRNFREPAIHKKTDGYLLIYPDSTGRFLSFWESVKHRLFGWTAQDFIDEETGADLFRHFMGRK